MRPHGVRWITAAACAWTVCFGVPHVWWALGISAGFPGGEDSYAFFMSSAWRVVLDLVVIALCVLAFTVAVTLQRPPNLVVRRQVPYVAAWLACGMLSLRGIAGMVVDGASDLVWWPAFLTGGVLFGAVAWNARTVEST